MIYFRVNLGLVLGILLVALLARQAAPASDGLYLFGTRMPDLCASKVFLGRPCRGCGLTASTVLAIQGRWEESEARHPSGTWVAGFLLAQFVARCGLLVARPSQRWVWRGDAAVSVAAFLLACYLPMFL